VRALRLLGVILTGSAVSAERALRALSLLAVADSFSRIHE
jgi:predicted membrane metal-binding protein